MDEKELHHLLEGHLDAADDIIAATTTVAGLNTLGYNSYVNAAQPLFAMFNGDVRGDVAAMRIFLHERFVEARSYSDAVMNQSQRGAYLLGCTVAAFIFAPETPLDMVQAENMLRRSVGAVRRMQEDSAGMTISSFHDGFCAGRSLHGREYFTDEDLAALLDDIG